MIACICRDISEDDYPDLKSLLERLSQPDVQCGKCNEYYRGLLGENKMNKPEKRLITEENQRVFRQWITDWSEEFERQRKQLGVKSPFTLPRDTEIAEVQDLE